MKKTKWLMFLAVIIIISIVSSCSMFEPKGNLSLELTDWPLDDKEVTAVNVTVTKVEARQVIEENDEANWITITEPNEEFNLLELQGGLTAPLGDAEIPIGKYTQMRLHVTEENTIEFINDTEKYPLKIPSGTSSGIKINYTFEIIEGESTSILLDFNAQESVRMATSGTDYHLTPVIKVKE